MNPFLRRVQELRDRERAAAIDLSRGSELPHDTAGAKRGPKPKNEPTRSERMSNTATVVSKPRTCTVQGCPRYVHWKSKEPLCGYHRLGPPKAGPAAVIAAKADGSITLQATSPEQDLRGVAEAMERIDAAPPAIDLGPPPVEIPDRFEEWKAEEQAAAAVTDEPAPAQARFRTVTQALGVNGDALLDAFCERWLADLRAKATS